MSLRPLLYHIFPKPLPYLPALALQEKIHSIQARSRTTLPSLDKEALSSPSTQTTLKQSVHPDVLLLLEHRPVYTAGRRQNAQELEEERVRLERSGADWVSTQRGGETTYHGPGQIVGYPLFDLPRMGIRTRDHVCKTQNLLKTYIQTNHGISPFESEHTGVFVSRDRKIASIGMQVRHGLTSHGFAINIGDEVLAWFNQVVACGLADVKAASVEGVKGKTGGEMERNLEEVERQDNVGGKEGDGLDIHREMKELARLFGESYKRQIQPLGEVEKEGDVMEIWEAVKEMEEVAERAGDWHKKPLRSVV